MSSVRSESESVGSRKLTGSKHSVDSETEAIMQDIIDTVFKDCTVLAVMHRLKHINRYDRVALLDSGLLLEYDAPTTLLGQESKFADLFQSSAR